MESRGCEIAQEMLLHSAKLIEKDESNAAVRDLLVSIGYDSSVAPLEVIREAQDTDTTSGITPLLPELFVRTRQQCAGDAPEGNANASEPAPYVALQLIRENDCFWCVHHFPLVFLCVLPSILYFFLPRLLCIVHAVHVPNFTIF